MHDPPLTVVGLYSVDLGLNAVVDLAANRGGDNRLYARLKAWR